MYIHVHVTILLEVAGLLTLATPWPLQLGPLKILVAKQLVHVLAANTIITCTYNYPIWTQTAKSSLPAHNCIYSITQKQWTPFFLGNTTVDITTQRIVHTVWSYRNMGGVNTLSIEGLLHAYGHKMIVVSSNVHRQQHDPWLSAAAAMHIRVVLVFWICKCKPLVHK